MDPIKHNAAYERADTLQQIAAEIRVTRELRAAATPTPAVTPAPVRLSLRPAAARRERCPDDLAQPRPA